MKKGLILTFILLAANIALLVVIVNGYNDRKREMLIRQNWEEGVKWYNEQKANREEQNAEDGEAQNVTDGVEVQDIPSDVPQTADAAEDKEKTYTPEELGINVAGDEENPTFDFDIPENAE